MQSLEGCTGPSAPRNGASGRQGFICFEYFRDTTLLGLSQRLPHRDYPRF
jgi:hypothetical protein